MNYRIVGRIVFILFAASMLACALFPFVFSMVQEWGWDYGLDRVFRRIWMISVVLSLIGSGRWIGFQHPAKVGYVIHDGWFRNIVIGAVIAWAFLLTLTGAYLAIGAWAFQDDSDFAKSLFVGLVRGALVAGLEEYIFRGLIFFSLRAHYGWWKAAVGCSLIFSSLHFLESHTSDAVTDPNVWWMGFYLCGQMTYNMLTGFTLFPDAVSLFVVGMILCFSVQQSGTLWYSAGLHGGWVWAAAVMSEVFTRTRTIDTFYLGGNRMFDGVVPFLGMFIIFPITHWLIQTQWVKTHKPNSPEQ